jgi:hypothetical protein
MDSKILAIAASAFILQGLAACTHKAVMKPSAEILGAGTYRSNLAATNGARTGLSLQLNSNGRFTLATLKGGCFVSEERGTWKSTQESLELRVQKSLRREECGSTWAVAPRDTLFEAMLRGISSQGFMMLHEEIAQGTEWTTFKRDDAQNFAMLEKGPGSDRVDLTLNADSNKESTAR